LQTGERVTGSGWSVRSKLMLAIVLVIIAIIGAQAALSIVSMRSRSEAAERENLQSLYKHYAEDVAIHEDAAASLARAFASRHSIARMLIQGDRDALYELLRPVFDDMRKRFGLTHMYVHQANGVVFLRVHNRRDFGDTSRVYRRTIQDAIEKRRTVAGIEFDHNRLGVRGVSPIVEDGALVGLVEVGLDYDRGFLEEMRQQTGRDFRLWVTLESAAPTGLWPGDGLPEPPMDDLFYYAGTGTGNVHAPARVYRRVLNDGHPRVWLSGETNGANAVLVGPLRAYGGRTVGTVEIIESRAETLAAIRSGQTRAVLLAAALALMGLLLLAGLIRSFVLKPLDKLAHAARRQFSGELRARVTGLPRDEFGRLGDTFNRLSDRLTATLANQEKTIAELREAQRNLADYRDTLEERVEERSRELEQAQQELVERERLATLGRLTATVSHELRNPLATISSSVYAVREMVAGLGMAPVHRALDRAERNVRRCDGIIEELLDYTRNREVVLQPTDLDEWVREMLDEMPVPEGIAVGWELESRATVDLNPAQFRRLLVNVMTNACEAILESNEPTGTVTVSTERLDGHVAVRFCDTGPGIPPDILERVFEPLFSTKGFGVGLGMAIVEQIAEQHGGEVRVESTPGEGTQVTVWLPVTGED
jgi:signal transduction histidine kinase